MADSEEWFVGEDGCLSVGKTTLDVTYHSTLNAILVTTKEPALRVLDVTSGSLLQISDLSAGKSDFIKCQYLPIKDKVLFSSGQSVCVRKDLNGVLLLDTALQSSASKTEDNVKVELPLPEANHLFKCLMGAELPGVDYVEDVLLELEREIEIVQQATKQNHKVAKWATVTLNLPHCALKSVCSNLVIELKRLHQNSPGLPVASAINDRLSFLLPSAQSDGSSVPVDRSLMFSEGARRETFAKWPHMNYKWALPDPMAQAGFYHQPSSTGDDRAMCFTCNVCLVCWEPTDEPWSEHERHSPQCPFVKGEYTQNVPMSVTYATEPSHPHGSQGEKIECVSNTTSDDYFATSTLHGNVVVWNMSRQVKRQFQFNIDPWEPVIAAKTGSHISVVEETHQVSGGEQTSTPQENWSEASDQNQPSSSSSIDLNTEPSTGDSAEDNKIKYEIIEVGGAWKLTPQNVIENIVEIPLDDVERVQEPFSRCRPSQDILVSSLCVLGPIKSWAEANPQTPTVIPSSSGAPNSKSESTPHIHPCLVSGVAIRRNTLTLNDVHLMSSSSTKTSEDTKIEVQAMNQVNQAISEDPQLISDIAADISASASSSGIQKVNPFVPYLLVHDISNHRSGNEREWKSRSVGPKDTSLGGKYLSTNVQDLLSSQIQMSTDDDDVQIIGVTPPPGDKNMPKFAFMPNLISTKDGSESQPHISEPGKKGSAPSMSSLAKWSLHKESRVVQCIELPKQVGCDQYVSSITPTLDGHHVVVVTQPRNLNKKMDILCGNNLHTNTSADSASQQADTGAGAGASEGATAAIEAQPSVGGCILVYKLITFSDMVVVEEKPCRMCVVDDIDDAVIHTLMLPTEVAQAAEEDEEEVDSGRADTPTPPQLPTGESGMAEDDAPDPSGFIAVTTNCGNIKILQLADFKVVAQIQAPEDDKFVSTTYCTGIDRLCCCSIEGKLQFHIIGPHHRHADDFEFGLQSRAGLAGTSSSDDVDAAVEHAAKAEELLVQQPLASEVLLALHGLTQFENLLPRFSATVPPCWNEIQQEQQQRRHPQHLHQQGEAMQHTRTWRLQQDNTSWDEHLFELVLPKPCCVGHLDLKFNLHPMCTNPPNVQVTLLKQSISNIGRGSQGLDLSKGTGSSEVDAKINFRMSTDSSDSVGRQSDEMKASVINHVLSQEFLDRHGAEIVCGPVDLATFVDLSNHSGVVTLTSPQVLKVKSKSFLLHLKAMPSNDKPTAEKPPKATKSSKESVKKSTKEKGAKDPLGFIQTAAERLSATSTKQKLENVKGCDWIQEISITVRKSKKTSVPKDRLQRSAMLELKSFHERLLYVVCGLDDSVPCTTSHEHQQRLALDILTWVTAIQMNDCGKGMEASCMVMTVQANLNGLVKACFLEGGRSIAHQCAKLVSLCIEFSKNMPDPNLAAMFSASLLQALLECLPLISCAHSAGALHWYFTLLNRVKCMDIGQTSLRCADMLGSVARHYHERANSWHAILKARFGLYGQPLEPEIFDTDPPIMSKSTSTPIGPVQIPATYAGMVGQTQPTTTSTLTGSAQGMDVADFQDLMSLCNTEKVSSSSSYKSQGAHMAQHVFGLLEVEPLHFTCHATSDGTRMERLDPAGGGTVTAATSGMSGLSGTINFGDNLSNAAGAALVSLSTAMASAEHQLQQVQHKQLQLFKLQQQKQKLEQKLAETSKNPSAPASGSTFVPYSSELFPPTPKNTPFFMTPPVTPPNESYHNIFIGGDHDPGKPPIGKPMSKGPGNKPENNQGKPTLLWPQGHMLFQHPPQQALVIERMHSGARRFVVLDFGHPILLTDLVIPSCNDLASLSIDIWIQGEEVDGLRLVVSSDIGMRSLIMNDIAPPPICRYLKITTIGRYGGSTTRSKIPIGSFYGHTFILPWESTLSGSSTPIPTSDGVPTISTGDQSQVVSQLSMYVSMLEDIQCRYSLACNRMVTLLTNVDLPQNTTTSSQNYFKKLKRSDENGKVVQAYQDCILLQLQWNLAQRAIDRIQIALGLKVTTLPSTDKAGIALLKQASTDKLRVLTELLLDTLLSMTLTSPSIPQIPVSLYSSFSPQMCEAVFRNLCITGTRKMQIHAGMLLVRICGGQGWWGDFLGNILQEFFSSGQTAVFPQDRVFILLTVLGQKSLNGSSSSEVLESMLMLLARLLFPLLNTQQQYMRTNATMLDLSLIGWLLLFLSKNLDIVSTCGNDDNDKGTSKDKADGMSSTRWDFIQGDAAMQNTKSTKNIASKLYRRKIQKRLMHHKQQFLELQQTKKNFLMDQAQKAMLNKDAEALIKKHEWMFMKQHKQYESKHFKDIMNIRRTDGEYLRKMPKDNGATPDPSVSDLEMEASLVVSREKCIPVVRGLIALILSMDFTCNVDLFIIACKVVARITSIARPAITLSEVMNQEELEKLIMLTCNIEYNNGNISWGGAWAGHSVTCLLLDILDGEKFYSFGMSPDGVTDDEIPSTSMETDDSLQNSATLPTLEEDSSLEASASAIDSPIPAPKEKEKYKFDKESSLIVDMLLEDEEYDDLTNSKLQEYLTGETVMKPEMPPALEYCPYGMGGVTNQVVQGTTQVINVQPVTSTSGGTGTINWGPPSVQFSGAMKDLCEQMVSKVADSIFDKIVIPTTFPPVGSDEKKTKMKSKLASLVTGKSSTLPQGVSTALDSRLENGVELTAELKLKLMLSLEADIVLNALSAPLPPTAHGVGHSVKMSHPPTDDEQISEASLLSILNQQQIQPSSEMLSVCFNNLFSQLQFQRINLDNLLMMWLTLNEDNSQEENGQSVFDPSRIPSIPLNSTSVTSLLTALAWTPAIPTRTWVLAFQTLTLLANLKTGDTSPDRDMTSLDTWLATVMVADGNMMNVLVKFLSGSSPPGPTGNANQCPQIGPTAVRAFNEFLVRLQLRCAEDNEIHMKELLLKLVYTLTSERGAFNTSQGPMDAQCKLLEHMLNQGYDGLDISNAISVIDSIVLLMHHHITSQERVVCKSTTEDFVSARSCFSGLFASMLRSSDSKSVMGEGSKDLLMCNLLKLVNLLIQIPLPGRQPRRNAAPETPPVDSSLTDMSKISQSLGAAVMTSTPNAEQPKSDEEKSGETDEQKSENGAGVKVEPRSCTHFHDLRNTTAEQKDPVLADVILGHRQIMTHLIQALSCCNSNTMAMILGSSGLQGSMQDSFTGIDPLSVGDAVFQILCTLNKKATELRLVLQPIHDYLSSGFQGIRQAGISRLSEPLLWYILRVLDCEPAIRIFLEMDGVEVVCHNLVNTNRRVINTSPSLISTMMQYLGANKSAQSLVKKSSLETENAEGLQNFAPYGTITSTSPTAGPADVLIQSSPPHRRARSAAWTYHFYPEEAWVDLSISLPCAVLLKEVHVQPHLSSLSTCPAAVSLEVSRDGTTMVPVSSPIITSGLTCIKVQLLKAEVASAVTIRLHKPRDSQTIGLSQILIMGSTAFGDQTPMKSSNIFTPTEDYVSRTSIGWLRLLHHCLTQCEEMQDRVAESASPTTNLLATCTALLVSPSSIVYSTNIEAVLLKIGLHSTNMGLSLIDHLLRNSIGASEDPGAGLPLHGKINGMANDSTVDIIYQLGVHQDASTAARIKALTEWLGDSARVALQKHHGGYSDDGYRPLPRHAVPIDLPSPAPAHVHCVATILWHSRDLAVTYDLRAILSRELLSSMYEWSTVLAFDSPLKKAVDSVICSTCYVHPQYFATILEWLGIMTPGISFDLSSAAVTDDHKDSQQQNQQTQEPITDDLKADSARLASSSRARNSPMAIPPILLQEFTHLILDESHLSTLATTCQSEDALQQLLDAGFVAVLCQGIYEFCSRELLRHSGSVPTVSEALTDNAKSETSSPRSPRSARDSPSNSARARQNSESSQNDKSLKVTADLMAPVLSFMAEVAKQVGMKNWLGSAEGSAFWPLLLRLLCTTPSHVISAEAGPGNNKQRVMTGQQRAAVEDATVNFFSSVLACHSDNQKTFANVLCEVIRGNGSGNQGHGYASSPLSGFLRRLFLQVLLEDEKILVCFKSTTQLYKGQSNALSNVIQHPRCGAGHKYRAIETSLNSTCWDVLFRVTDTPSLTNQILEDKDGKLADEIKKDTSELGIEVVEQISAVAGLQAKEKRDKSKTPAPPPRPPSRRGVRPPDTSMVQVPIVSLFHRLMPGQTFPNDLSLSQLLVLLHERGLPAGLASLDFIMKLRTKKMNVAPRNEKRLKTDQADTSRQDSFTEDLDAEIIPEDVLIDTPAFPSALQVFAGVGGLALLAEHLPLLYPEVTRQVTPLEVTKENSSNLGHDWVNVESAEDMYEEIYEPPLPSTTQSQSKQPSATMPSIPPHSLVAFGLFLRLPGYAEVLLKEKKRAQCLLRLVLGVTDDGEGGHILTSPVAGSLPTLPFNVLKTLFDTTPLSTDDGVLLRRMTLDIGAIHLILACLSVLSHHAPRQPIPGFHQEIIQAATQAAAALASNNSGTSTTKPAIEGKGQNYWARGTGFGTGSTASSWDAEQALLRQKSEEEHVTCLLQVLASCVNPGGGISPDFMDEAYTETDEVTHNGLPSALPELLSQSCLVPAISSYLRNDSVLDMARHVPLYRALLELLRGIAVCPVLVPLLLPLDKDDDSIASVSSLLDKMKACVDTYASRLKSNKNKSKNRAEDEESEGLALLIPDIQETAQVVDSAIQRVKERTAEKTNEQGQLECDGASRMDHSEEQRYMVIMKELQFDTYEMVTDEDGVLKFNGAHHYESNVRAAGDVSNAGRARRLAQEAVTLSTSLPLSASSSVFVRCDEERLDVMKVLITGPSETPYCNGAFEFDVYFPQDYPNSPPLINMETTGNHTVRFNPNLYNDGKVCLSILNTWHGRPEEKWNSQTSSFLQVLVSIQSLILVSEPYFNEPGYERSRGTPSGQASSREYDANIRQATVKWAMLEMIRNAPQCFKGVLDRHFWMKRHEITKMIEEWIAEMEAYTNDKRVGRTISHSLVALKRHYSQLKEEFAKMKVPSDCQDDDVTPVPEQNGMLSNGSGHGSTTSSTSSLPSTKAAPVKSETAPSVSSPAAKVTHPGTVWQASGSESTTGDSSTGSSSTDSDSNMAGNISESSGPLMMTLPMNHDGGINNNNSAEGLIPNGNAEEDDTDW